MKRFIFFLIIIIVFTSCEKTITVDIPQRSPKLVINGWVQKDDVIRVFIGKSRNVLQPLDQSLPQIENYVVKDATAVLYEDNVAIDTLDYVPFEYTYISADTLHSGKTYTLKVTAPGFTEAEVTTGVPSQSTITSVQRIRNARTTSDGVMQDEVLVKLNDPMEANYYLVQFYRAPYMGQSTGMVYCVSTTDKDIEPIGDEADPFSTDNCYDGSSLLMGDANFNGQEKILRFFIDSYELSEYTGPLGEIYLPYVKVNRITEDYFRFVKSYHVHYNSTDNPFAEPSNVYSNVKNGYGSFTAYTMAVDSLR